MLGSVIIVHKRNHPFYAAFRSSTREEACESLMVFTVLAIALQVPKSRSCQLQVFDFALTRHLELC